MHRQVRIAGISVVAAAAGVGAAVAAGAAGGGGSDVRACAVNTSGRIVARPASGCARGQIAITISGDAFKRSRNDTLTINGVAFKRSGQTITINGTAFKRGSRQTITINGTTFKRGSGQTITINGTTFKRGSGQTITINGIPFQSSGRTLTINGTAFAPGSAAQPGPQGPAGPAGPSARSGAPAVADGPVSATVGNGPADLVSASFTVGDGTAHRVLLAGGFDAECETPCASPSQGVFDMRRGSDTVFTRRLPAFVPPGITSMSGTFSEVVDAPANCTPCTFTLRLQANAVGGGGGAATLRATAIRLGVVDLGQAAQ